LPLEEPVLPAQSSAEPRDKAGKPGRQGNLLRQGRNSTCMPPPADSSGPSRLCGLAPGCSCFIQFFAPVVRLILLTRSLIQTNQALERSRDGLQVRWD